MDGHWVAAAAGHIEVGESAQVAALREAREELGVTIEPDALIPATLLQRTDGTADPLQQRADWYFIVHSWHGSPQIQEPEKCAGLEWHSLDALPNPIPGYEAVVLQGLAQGDLAHFTYYGFCWQTRSDAEEPLHCFQTRECRSEPHSAGDDPPVGAPKPCPRVLVATVEPWDWPAST